MPVCNQCGVETDEMSYRCNYCDQYHCREHRLPENHDCPATGNLGRPTSLDHESDAVLVGGTEQRVEPVRNPDSKPYSVYKPTETVGTAPEWEGASSPDVNPDGSLADDTDVTPEQEPVPRSSTSSRRWIALLVLAIVAVAIVAYLFV